MNLLRNALLIGYMSLSTLAGAQDLYNMDTVRTGYLTFYDSNWQTLLDSFKTNDLKDRVLASITVDGIVMDSVGVRFKGNSSYNSSGVKKPFNIKLDYTSNQDLYGYTTLKLNNIFKDPSCVREALGYEMLRNYMPASQANYMQLYIDGTLHGMYTSVESINDDFNLSNFGSNSGSFFKCDPIFGGGPLLGCPPVGGGKAALIDQGTDTACYKTSYDIKSDSGWVELVNLIQFLNFNVSQIESVLNVDRALWMLAYNNVFANFDSYTGSGHNYYVYEDEYRFNTITWDLNESFGAFTNGGGQPPSSMTINDMQNLTPLWNDQSPVHPLINKLLSNADYKKRYMAHFRTIYEEQLVSNAMKNRAVQLQAIADPFAAADPNSYYGYASFQNGLDQNPSGVVGINVLMDARSTYLSTDVEVLKVGPTISSIQQSNLSPSGIDSVWITASVVNAGQAWLHYKVVEFAPFVKVEMFDDGIHNDGASGDGVFGAMVPAQSPATTVYYFIYAANGDAGKFSPARAEYEYYSYTVEGVQLAPGELVINEFMASNQATQTDQNGEFDDWIELYNNTSSSISLNNMYLSDDASAPQKWRFPDTSIGANDFLIVWADNDLQTGIHGTFKLSASGETVVLSNSDGTVLDSITYSAQTTDLTTGRYPNGTGNFQVLAPTFSAVNDALSVVGGADTEEVFSIYPNPGTDHITIEFSPRKLESENLLIFNSLLQEIGNVIITHGQRKLTINTLNYSEGIYFLRLGSTSKKVVITR